MKSMSARVRMFILLVVLVLPILAACGGPSPAASPGTETSPAPAASPDAVDPGTVSPSPDAAASPDASEASPSPDAAASPSPDAAASPSPDAAASPGAGAGAEVPAEASEFLVFGNAGEPDSLDTMSTTSGQALVVALQVTEQLIGRAEPGSQGELSPLLATEWEPNEDFTEWTFTLREGVEFHDGTPFNAEAVVFNFRRLMEEDFEFGFRDEGKTYPVVGSIFGGFAGDPDSSWGGIEAVDEYTVRFTMNQPMPLLPEILSATYFSISSPQAVQEAGVQYGTPDGGVVGTGAFKFESWSPGQNIILTRNEDYWGEAALMPGAVIRFLADAPARLAELQAGAIDFATQLSVDARATVESDANLKEVEVEPFNVAYLAMNFNTEPFTDTLVRQAVAHAINKQEILDAFYGGVGEVATSFLPPELAELRPTDAPTYDYDPERARELLAEAGYPDGFDTEFWYMPVSRPYFPTPQSIAEALAAQLADVGINAQLQTEDWGVYLDNVDAGEKQGMWMLGWTGDYADPNNFLYTFFGPNAEREQGYRNDEVINLLQEAAGQSPEEAVATFQEAQTLIAQDVPRIPIVHSPPVYGAQEGLEGWEPSRYGSEPWKTLFIEK